MPHPDGRPSGRAKRHHQVPAFYLRHFADPEDRVRVYDRMTSRVFTVNVANAGVESNLYTVPDAAGEPSDEVEQFLATIEGFAARALLDLLAPQPSLSTIDRRLLAHFLALQFVRTTAARAQLEDVADLFLRLDVDSNVGGDPPDAVERFIAKRYPDARDAVKQQIRAVAASPSRPVPLATEDWLDTALPLVPDLADLLLLRRWVLFHTDERAFLTCDHPVTLVGSGHSHCGVGLLTAEAILVPLSPYRVLVMTDQDTGTLSLTDADRHQIRWVNRLVAERASRQIYYHPNSNPLAGIQIAVTPSAGSVNGIPVSRGERSYDKLREDFVPNLQRVRDDIRARRGSGQV